MARGGAETVAVLGAGGTMGFAMARNIARAGIAVRAWNRTPAKAAPLAADGAYLADTPADAAAGAGIVLTMLSDADAVVSVMEGDDGALPVMTDNGDPVRPIWLQMSTIGEEGTDWCAGLAHQYDVGFVDAPVLGTRQPAEQGQLVVLESGAPSARCRVQPVFDAVGQRTVHAGPAGAGTRLKLVNNTWLAFANEAVAASVALARRLGLDVSTVAEAIGDGPLISAWQAAKLQRIARGEFAAQFALSLALKDVHLAQQALGEDRFAVLDCLADEWQEIAGQGLGDQDLTVVKRALEQQQRAQ